MVSTQTVRAAVALERASRLTGLDPLLLEVLADVNQTVEDSGPKRVRLMHRLVDQAAGASPHDLSRPRACRIAAWSAREALRKAGVSEPAVEHTLQQMAAGERVSLLTVGDALVGLERLDTSTGKAAGRARYAAEVALGLATTGDDWRERFTLAVRHATAAVALGSGSDDLERFFAQVVRRLAGDRTSAR